jgi:hypothetical protein
MQEFIVRINPAGFGYRTAHVLVGSNGIFKEDMIKGVKEFGDLAYRMRHT